MAPQGNFERRQYEVFSQMAICAWFRASMVHGICDGGDRPNATDSRTTFFGNEMADDRAVPRRESKRCGGGAGKCRGLLFCGGWRGRVENDRWRNGVEANFRQRASRFDWSAGAGAFESEHHLRWNGCE